MDPRTKAEFEELSTRLGDLILSKYSSKPLYAAFVEHHVRLLCSPLKDLDVRKASSTLAALANEKQKSAKEALGGAKKKKAAAKPVLGGAKTTGLGRAADTSAYVRCLASLLLVRIRSCCGNYRTSH